MKRILKLGFLQTVQPNSFSKFISAVCNFKNNAQETYLFVSNFWFCHLITWNFFAYFKFHSDWGRVISKIKQNELYCRDTAPLRWSDICVFIDLAFVLVDKNTKKNVRPIFCHLDRTSLVNRRFITWPKRELLLAGPTRKSRLGKVGRSCPIGYAHSRYQLKFYNKY